MTTIGIILILIAQAVIIYYVSRPSTVKSDYAESRRSEWTCEMKGDGFTDIDLTAEVLETVTDICKSPENWTSGRATLDHRMSSTSIWVCNDIKNRCFYRGPWKEIKLTAADQWALDVAYRKHLEWQDKMRSTISKSELLEISVN